jgi:phospholipid-binding lipoprotein MlaA
MKDKLDMIIQFFKPFLRVCIVLLFSFSIVACASAPSDPDARAAYDQANDPLEPLNRGVFAFNIALDKAVLRPLGKVYEAVLPKLARNSIRNFLRNLKTPLIVLNDLLQGNVKGAGQTMARFSLNTLAGFGGIIDIAGDFGITYRQEDFGQTFAVWGLDEGPYLMLPLLGPSSLRDTAGLVPEYYLDPINNWARNTDTDWVPYTRMGVKAIDDRSRNYKMLEDLEETSLDFYAAIRSLYRQTRTNLIKNGKTVDSAPVSSINFEIDQEDEYVLDQQANLQ